MSSAIALPALPRRSSRAGCARGSWRGARPSRPTRPGATGARRYWARPLPGFGDPAARSAGGGPGARRARRQPHRARSSPATARGTGCSRPCIGPATRTSPRRRSRDDGLRLSGAYIAAVVRCAPPANRPTPAERDTCLPYLVRELRAAAGRAGDRRARELRVGRCAARRCARAGVEVPRPKPRFGHGAEAQVGPYTLIGCFHPSQQNTFTGKLTEPMMDAVFARAPAIPRRARCWIGSPRVKELAPGLHTLERLSAQRVQRLPARDRRGRGPDRHGHAFRAAPDPAPGRGAGPDGDLHHPRPPRPCRSDARRRRRDGRPVWSSTADADALEGKAPVPTPNPDSTHGQTLQRLVEGPPSGRAAPERGRADRRLRGDRLPRSHPRDGRALARVRPHGRVRGHDAHGEHLHRHTAGRRDARGCSRTTSPSPGAASASWPRSRPGRCAPGTAARCTGTRRSRRSARCAAGLPAEQPSETAGV